MGRALKNLDGLLRMPYGCGEQNMAVLAPDIYILQYLEITKQLTPDIREKAVRFLSSGKGFGGARLGLDVRPSLPHPVPSASVLRLSETAELQASRRRLQHIRSRGGQQLVRARPKTRPSRRRPPFSQRPASLSPPQAHRLRAAVLR